MRYRHIKSLGEGRKLYEFTPSINQLLYAGFLAKGHFNKIRFLMEYLHKGHYKVYYLEIDGALVGYCMIAPGGRRLKCSTRKDIVVGPYFIKKEERGKGYSEVMLRASLENSAYKYENAYDWIKNTNIPSIKASEACGFEKCGELNVVGRFHRLAEVTDGEYSIYRKNKM